LLLLPALLAIMGAWFAVRWYVGNTVAEYAPSPEEGGIDMARLATKWAPADPLTHWRLASFEEKVFSADNLADAAREYQSAVEMSPNDYRYWMELGRALEANGDRESAEKALRRAVELAPAYSHPRWYFGNLLLREGKVDESFEQLGHAAEADDAMRSQVFTLAFQILGGDLDVIAKVACPTALGRAQFAIFLAASERFDDAVRMWGTISPADRQAQKAHGEELRQILMQLKQFRAAVALMRELDPNASLPQLGQVSNGGFESELAPANANIFDWIFSSRPPVQISIDSRAHTGHSSLRIIFKEPRSLDQIPLLQTVLVEPDTQYRFECYVRTEDLNSAATPIVAINDAANTATLGTSQPLPTGTSDWQRITFDIKTKPNLDGVMIRFFRPPCDKGEICPIFGTVWYDDFNLQRIGGSGSSGRNSGSAKR
jgi:hypothetical protein